MCSPSQVSEETPCARRIVSTLAHRAYRRPVNDADINGLLHYAQLHNRNTQLVEYQEFNQVVQDFVICGLNDDPSDRARRCHP